MTQIVSDAKLAENRRAIAGKVQNLTANSNPRKVQRLMRIYYGQRNLNQLECDNQARIQAAKAKGLTHTYILHPTKGWRKIPV